MKKFALAAVVAATISALVPAVATAQNVATVNGKPVPKAIIAPHAGYIYSGAIAATVYARLAPVRDQIKRRITDWIKTQ